MTMQDSTSMTELEGRLAEPGGSAVRDALVERARAIEASLRAKLAASVPRSQFAEVSACADAAHAAAEVLRDWPAAP